MRLVKPGDAVAICAMPSAGRWRHVKEASSALRTAALSIGSEQSDARDTNVLLFEIDREIVAAAALRRAMESDIAQLITLILHQEMRGCHLREQPREPLCVVVLQTTMRFATGNGYTRMATHIAHADRKGLRLAQLAGFARVGHADKEHGVWAVSLR
jgi:hypothetical protein